MEERRFRLGALFEWAAAAAAVLLVLWVLSVSTQRLVGHGVQAAMAEAELAPGRPPGVPPNATLVPVMLLLDGSEIRQGDLHSRVDAVLPSKLAEGPPTVSSAQFGERHTRAYRLNGTKVYIVCERTEQDGPMKVAGIYLP